MRRALLRPTQSPSSGMSSGQILSGICTTRIWPGLPETVDAI